MAVDGEPELPLNLGGDPSPAKTIAKMMNQRKRKRRDVNIEICIFMHVSLIVFSLIIISSYFLCIFLSISLDYLAFCFFL